jgi:O-antigen ligase
MLNKFHIGRILDVFFLITILLIPCTVFIVTDKLVYGVVSGKYFWFYVSMVLLSVSAIPVTIVNRKRLSFKIPDLLILLFCGVTVIITFNHEGRLINKCMLLVFLTVLYFYLRIFFLNKSRLKYSLCLIFFIVTGLVEAVWGLMQLYGFIVSQHNLFKITGSFFNPGPYSGWLAMVFPIALGYAIFNRKKNIQNLLIEHENISRFIVYMSRFPTILGLFTVFCIFMILPSAMSRASWLAALGGSGFIVVMYGLQNKKIVDQLKKYRKRLVILLIAAFVLFIVAMTGLFLLKKDSASGRVFTWKIALQTIKENPLGVGLGNFGGSYGDAQAAYFASGAGTEREKYIADSVEYAFNEYLQICIETGIIPFLVFIAFVFCILYSGIKNRNYLSTGSLISLLIFAAMSYPFNILPFVIAFVFLSVLCLVSDENEKPDKKKMYYPKFAIWFFLFIAPISLANFSTFNFQLYRMYKQWYRAQILNSMNFYVEAIEEYAEQYPYLQDDIQFLFEYAQSLTMSAKYSKSNEILRRATKISCAPMLYIIMGKNYQALKKHELAEQSFRKAANLVPNRLYPHYLLAKLYHEMGLKDKMEQEINIVMTKPPKVESKAVEEMREELKTFLSDE